MHPHMRFSLQPLPSRGCGSCQHRRLWNHTQTLVQQRAEEWIKHQFLKWIISEMTVNDFQPPTQIDMKPCFKKSRTISQCRLVPAVSLKKNMPEIGASSRWNWLVDMSIQGWKDSVITQIWFVSPCQIPSHSEPMTSPHIKTSGIPVEQRSKPSVLVSNHRFLRTGFPVDHGWWSSPICRKVV